MNQRYGGQTMVEPLRRVLVRRPDAAFGAADPAKWHYSAQPNLKAAEAEHDAFVHTLRRAGVEVIYHETPLVDHADAIFVHDPVILCNQGAIILKMGKPLRHSEPAAITKSLTALDIPIHYTLHGDAIVEGGDLLWINAHTLAVGQGFRTNAEGLRQLREALEPHGVELIPVHLPYYHGPDACLHLMSVISIVDYKLAVIYPPLVPVPFWQYLKAQGFSFVEVPEEEFDMLGPNVLALAPGVCLMLDGNPTTMQRLVQAGCEVQTYKGDEISLKAEGGATCLTRAILRGQTGVS